MKRSALALGLTLALAACARPTAVEVTDAWTRDTVGRTANAAVFMTITSPTADRLVAASASVAGKTDLMTMRSADGAMAMTYLDAISIPAGAPVSLDPAGLHVWLADLRAPLEAGQSFPLVLEFEKAGELRVEVAGIAPAAAAPGASAPPST